MFRRRDVTPTCQGAFLQIWLVKGSLSSRISPSKFFKFSTFIYLSASISKI